MAKERFNLNGQTYEVDHDDKSVFLIEAGKLRPTGGGYALFMGQVKRKRVKATPANGFGFRDAAEEELFKRATGKR